MGLGKSSSNIVYELELSLIQEMKDKASNCCMKQGNKDVHTIHDKTCFKLQVV